MAVSAGIGVGYGIAALVAAAIGTGMFVSGASKRAKAKRIAAANTRPEYNINPEETTNQNLAGSLAGQGLPDSTKQYYDQQSQRGLMASIDGILKGGGNVNNINTSYQNYNDGNAKLAMMDDQQRLSNIQAFVAQNQRMSDQRDKAWQINKYAPYADTAAKAAEMNKSGENQEWQGISMVGSAASSYAGGKSNQKDVNAVNGGGNGAVTPSGIGGGAASGMSSSSNPGDSSWGGVSSGMMGGFNRRYNTNTGQYSNTTNWDKMSPENQAMINSIWSTNARPTG